MSAALGLSADQMKQMVNHAKTYHDLLQEILARAPGLVDRLSEADQREMSLSATLDLYKQRWEALIAGPLFERFIGWLQQILKWTEDHNDEVESVGKAWGKVVDLGAQFVQNFVEGNWDELKSSFAEILKLVTGVGIWMVGLVNSVMTLINLAKVGGEMYDKVHSGSGINWSESPTARG